MGTRSAARPTTIAPAAAERELPLPPFFSAAHAEDWSYHADVPALGALATAWRRQHGLHPAVPAGGTVLLLVDEQKDFCAREGTLFVGGPSGRGASDDAVRTARFVYHNLHTIDQVVCTLDAHVPFQIFFPAFWLEGDEPPRAHREVRLADLQRGALRPHPDMAALLTGWAGGDRRWLEQQVAFYCRELERQGRYTLYLWPPHCLVGSAGHSLLGVIEEARLFHSFARSAENPLFLKGQEPLTEHYSVLRPEITAAFDGRPLWRHARDLADRLLAADRVIVAGQASSHCVRATLLDLLELLRAEAPRQVERVYLLEDCMSPVVVPDPERPGTPRFDFSARADEALAHCAAHGMHRVTSIVPMASWPALAPA